jgi:hypothetical protein
MFSEPTYRPWTVGPDDVSNTLCGHQQENHPQTEMQAEFHGEGLKMASVEA